jgi:hypothetical protein
MNSTWPTPPEAYGDWLAQLKTDIALRRQRAALAVNAELIALYARIGRDILDRQQQSEIHAFFAQHCPDGQFGQQAADQLPWFHIVTLLTKLDEAEARAWYAEQAALHGWSHTTLEVNIRNRLQQRQGAAVTNFEARLPSPHSALARETLKDPYLMTNPLLACCCVGRRSGWWLNTRSPASKNPSAWPSTSCCAICRNPWGAICRASSRSKPSLPASGCPKMRNQENRNGLSL